MLVSYSRCYGIGKLCNWYCSLLYRSTLTRNRYLLAHGTQLYVPRVHSTVRGAMVGVMLAGVTSPSRSSPGLVEEEDAGRFGESSHDVGGIAWRISLATESGPSGALPRDPATCVLWCTIALGALVRGTPMDHVGVAPNMSS